MPVIPFTDPRFGFRNEPTREPQISDHEVTLFSNDKTDWWRTLERDSGDGVVYGFSVPLTEKGLEISVDIELEWTEQLGPSTWVKAGLEFDNGQVFAGAVVTYPYSDWSIQPTGSSPPKRFTLTLKDRKLKMFIDGVMAREVNVFGDGDENEAFVGVMTCSPKGKGGKAVFRTFDIQIMG